MHRICKDAGIDENKLLIAPLKGRDRARAKVRNEYNDEWCRLVDVVRGSCILDSEKHMIDIYNKLKNMPDVVDIVRVKNRFNPPNFNGYRDVLMNIKVENHICDLQLHIEEIKNFTDGLNYPLYYLDFETIGPAVPKYNGSRPYQQLVFQYSLHVQETSSSELEHREYLADPSQDPRIGFIEQLIQDCGNSGDLLVYNIGFERKLS